MVSSISFRRFRALRDAQLALHPFNLVVGPNGSGKTSLIDALGRLRWLSRLPPRTELLDGETNSEEGPEIEFHFDAPFEALTARLSCVSDLQCDMLDVRPGIGEPWPALRTRIQTFRSYLFDHHAIAAPMSPRESGELSSSGANLPALLHRWRGEHPAALSGWLQDFRRFFTEYIGIETRLNSHGLVEMGARLEGEGTWIPGESLSQGTLYTMALLALAHQPQPPALLCIEEIDRGIHPRLLRQVRDALYRLSHPASHGLSRPPTQIVATTHSPYVLDLFRDHPEEVVISSKQGAAAHFTRLTEHPLCEAILSSEGSLGDLWYSGVFGGVPADPVE